MVQSLLQKMYRKIFTIYAIRCQFWAGMNLSGFAPSWLCNQVEWKLLPGHFQIALVGSLASTYSGRQFACEFLVFKDTEH